jgi:uroporphyrin-III C-methyltransferase / precorrin-2 dehydrogenase / sirohydrochlorin ferrochelatase
MYTSFPLFLPLDGKLIVLVGSGALALRKARLFANRGARLILVDPKPPEPALHALIDAHKARAFEPADVHGAVLVVAATQDLALAQQVAYAAKAAGVLVNVVDQPQLCTATFGGLVERGPISIAIGSGGSAPVLVRRVREAIERALPANLGLLAQLLSRFRAASKALLPDVNARRAFWERVVDGPIGAQALAGDSAGAASAVLDALNRTTAHQAPEGQVTLVGAGPGDPDLLTLKAVRALQDADVVVYDQLVDARILDYARRDASFIFVGKSKANHALSQEAINALLVYEAQKGQRVARLKGGDPFIFGRGGEEVAACRHAGVAVQVIPGISAALGCGASAQIPLTQRNLASGVTLITGHAQSLNPQNLEELANWAALAQLNHTLVIYMGLTKAGMLAQAMLSGGFAADTPAALVAHGTRPDQKLRIGTLAQLEAMAAGLDGPTLLIIGAVASMANPALVESLFGDLPPSLCVSGA